jgi:hypothetical protein
MKDKHPTWLLLGCQAHAFSLLIKDLQSEKTLHCAWSKRVYSTALMMSNTINGVETVRSALRSMQQDVYQKVKGIRTHCPTRFAILHMICCDIVASEEAIRRMVAARNWDRVASSSTHKDDFYAAATHVPARGRAPAFYFFDEVEALITVVQPICDAIHQIEADKPLLSQMLPIWKQLLQHAANFDAHPDNVTRPEMLPLFERRYIQHRDKAWTAAFVLDPIHATCEEGEWRLPFSTLELLEMQAVRKCLLELAGVEHEAALLAELARLQLAALPEAMCDALPMLTARTLVNGKTVVADSAMRRGWWHTYGRAQFPNVARVAMRLLSFHVTACASERNWSLWGNVYPKCRNRLALEKGNKLVFIKGNGPKGDNRPDEEVMLSLLEEEG